ncbi:hypothetical protein SDC9_116225 [bioreactor metagenome]|uniref:Uncharacterized protein n=1 Tax=bioreactor metagenome TaxID=1076179 RepID=A0A645BXA2_9ZZZZ
MVGVVHQVEINMVGLEPRELFIKKPRQVLRALHEPGRKLCGEKNTVSKAELFQHPADDFLALASVVGIGGIPVVDAEVVGLAEERRRLLFINVFGDSAVNRQPHAAKAKRRYIHSGFTHFTVLHLPTPPDTLVQNFFIL